MKTPKQFLSCILFLICIQPLLGQQNTRNVILVTMDGFRWEELFGGAVDSLMNETDYVRDTLNLQKLFDGPTGEIRREKLMPWFWSTLVTEGQIYGNKWLGNEVRCSNTFWFSYPGYNEILTGFSDPSIDSNAKIYNHNMTVLEWLHFFPEFREKVAAFASWDVFPFIINDQRSGIPVNAGFRKAQGPSLTEKEIFLNLLQDEIPSPWSSVRLDAFTHHYMMSYLKKHHPRIVFISYGETDDFAHDGRYDQYLKSAHQTDQWIEQLWTFIQSDEFYMGRTTLIITSDHGRGHTPKSKWKGHGKTYEGSPYIWMAAIGPDTQALGEINTNTRLFQNQIASTVAALLNKKYVNQPNEVGPPVKNILSK